MSNWKWEGFNREGKKIKGVIDARNEKEVKRLLRKKGIRTTRVIAPSVFEVDIGEWLVEHGYAKAFGNKELVNFTRQLSVMVNAGVPILQALEILFKQEKNPVLKKCIKNISEEVGGGKSLSDAMAGQKGFNQLYTNLVRAGEAGGILDQILDKLSIYMEKQEKIKSQIKSAMTYPLVVIFVGAIVIYAMMVWVVPKFTDLITESGQEIPFVTQLVIDASKFLQDWTLILVPSFFVLLVILSKFAKSPVGKPLFDSFLMNLPLFGGIIIKGNLASFLKTLSTMLSSGVSLIDSLDICGATIDNVIIVKDIEMVRKAVTEGKTLTEPITQISYFPEMVAQMIKVGEQTGNLDAMMGKVSDLFEQEVTNLIESMTKLIEPIILVVLGGIVAVILVAMYLPIFLSAGGVGG